MLQKSGCYNIVQNDSKQAPGLDIHEMGGVRMGRDPKTSLLNKYNQLHACTQCICYRWRLHDISKYTEPFAYIYGHHSPGRRSCSE